MIDDINDTNHYHYIVMAAVSAFVGHYSAIQKISRVQFQRSSFSNYWVHYGVYYIVSEWTSGPFKKELSKQGWVVVQPFVPNSIREA